MYKHVIFDLDGTLLNTIDDLADTGNHVCELHGWPTYTVAEFKLMVGNGIPKLVERFAPQGTSQEVLDQAFQEFMDWYGVHKEDKTAPYAGMPEVTKALREAGVSIAVLSNKADVMAGLGATQEDTLFVGDSNVDIRTAKNGGLTGCGVLWGFRSREELEAAGADVIVSTPQELLDLILKA